MKMIAALAMLVATTVNAAPPTHTGPCMAIEEVDSPATGPQETWFEVFNHDQIYDGKLLPYRFSFAPETVLRNIGVRVKALDLVTGAETAAAGDTIVIRRSYPDGTTYSVIFHCISK